MTSGPDGFGNPWMARLTELGEPEAVAWWPPAPGWYLVGCVLLAGVSWLLWRGFRRWQAGAYRRQALRRLASLEGLVFSAEDRGPALAQLPVLLRQTALSAFPRSLVASLSGIEWTEFLDCTGDTSEFTEGPGRILQQLAYTPEAAASVSDSDLRELFALSRRWIQQSRRSSFDVERWTLGVGRSSGC